MPITTGAHPKALWPGIAAWFGKTYAEYAPQYPEIYKKRSSGKAYEEDVETSGFGLAQEMSQGTAVSYDTDAQGYTYRYTHVNYGLGYIVTSNELEDNQYAAVSKTRSSALAFSTRQTLEVLGADIINNAYTATGVYAGPDALALCSATHPLIGGGTFSNTIDTDADLSESALEDLFVQITKAVDGKSNRISIMPEALLIPTDLQFEAARILKSPLQSGTANNDLNALKTMGIVPKIIVNNYLTDTDAWFLLTNCPNGLSCFMRKPVTFSTDNEFDTNNAKAKAVFRVVFGCTDRRAIYGSAGA